MKKDAVIEYPEGKGIHEVRGIPPASEAGPSEDGEEHTHTPGETHAETVATTAETAELVAEESTGDERELLDR